MITPTEAERLGLTKCPVCEMRRLKETIDAQGSVHHSCLSCSYLAVWIPRREWTPEERRRTLETHKKATGSGHFTN